MLQKRKKGYKHKEVKPKNTQLEGKIYWAKETINAVVRDPTRIATITHTPYVMGVDPIQRNTVFDTQSLETQKKLMELYSGKNLSEFLTEYPMTEEQSFTWDMLANCEKHERRKIDWKGIDGTDS